MRDLKKPAAIWMKGGLFLAIGIASAALLLVEVRTLRGCLLLVLSIWAFCRAYYFAFYVIEKYVDPGFRFSGLVSFLRYLFHRKRKE